MVRSAASNNSSVARSSEPFGITSDSTVQPFKRGSPCSSPGKTTVEVATGMSRYQAAQPDRAAGAQPTPGRHAGMG
jgi:hypothetical protein